MGSDPGTKMERKELPPNNVLPVGSGGVGGLLRAAAAAGSAMMVRSLLDAGVSPFEADSTATQALHLAAKGGHVHVFQMIGAAAKAAGTCKPPAFLTYNMEYRRPLDFMIQV